MTSAQLFNDLNAHWTAFIATRSPPASQKLEPAEDTKIKHDLNLVKLDALTQGKFTDCIFLVGPEDGKQEEVHAVKSMMMMASSFMEGLFRSPLCPPGSIRIKDVDLKIFKMIVEFIHLGQVKTQFCCADLVDLMIAADLYLIDSLKAECFVLLQKYLSAPFVWSTLEKLLWIDNLKSAATCCTAILRNKTKECLDHPTFLTATSECVNFLLNLDTLRLKYEWQLVDYCVKWAQHQLLPRICFREVLGKLRLLTLTPEEMTDLPFDYFSPDEIQAILKVGMGLDLPQGVPCTLCPLNMVRNFTFQKKRKYYDDYLDYCSYFGSF